MTLAHAVSTSSTRSARRPVHLTLVEKLELARRSGATTADDIARVTGMPRQTARYMLWAERTGHGTLFR